MPGTTAAQSLYELAFDRIPVPAILLDPKRRVLRANAPAGAVLEMDPDELVGVDLTEIIQTEDPTWCSTDPVDQLGTPTIGRKLEAKVGGKRRILRVALYTLAETEDAEPSGMMVTVRDAAAKERDLREAQDHQASLEELCACVAHEIRNPLTGIRTTVQFVNSKLGREHPSWEDLAEVLTEMDRIEQIIGDLLRFGRPAEITKEKSDLNALVARVVDNLEPQFRDAEIELRRNLSPDVPPFWFSPDNLQQVLLNLLHNGREAMPEGGRITVTSSLRRFRSGRDPLVEIFVSDSGHGIPDDLLAEIFKPFFTTRHNGTGLGLPISLAIVRAHGGRITARNRMKGGASFRVSLPLVLEDDSRS